MVWCLRISENMQPWQHSYNSDSLSLKTINTDIYPHVKRFGCVVNTNFTPTCIVLLNLFFCLSIPSNTVGLLQVVKRSTQFIFGRVYVYFQLGSMHLDYSHSLFLCFVCRPVRSTVLTASPRLPVAHLQEGEERENLSESWGAFRYSHFWQAASFCHMVFITEQIPLITPRALPGIYSSMFYVSMSVAENNDKTW